MHVTSRLSHCSQELLVQTIHGIYTRYSNTHNLLYDVTLHRGSYCLRFSLIQGGQIHFPLFSSAERACNSSRVYGKFGRMHRSDTIIDHTLGCSR